MQWRHAIDAMRAITAHSCAQPARSESSAAMFKEKRKSPRRAISRLAKIELSGGLLTRDCLVTDMSDGGVRIYIEGVTVPDTFVLLLPDNSSHIRPRDCEVVWRLGYEIGAKFTDAVSRGRPARTKAKAKQPAAA